MSRNSDNEIKNHKCAVCGYERHKQERQTYRICELERASKFFDNTRLFKDDVYTRYSHLQTATDVFAADIYCHKTCIKSHLKKYDDIIKSSKNQSISRTSVSNNNEANDESELQVTTEFNSKFDAISRITQANELTNSSSNILNIDVKNYIQKHHSDTFFQSHLIKKHLPSSL